MQTHSNLKPRQPGQSDELLAPVYGWFTEGFDTRDLKEAPCSMSCTPEQLISKRPLRQVLKVNPTTDLLIVLRQWTRSSGRGRDRQRGARS